MTPQSQPQGTAAAATAPGFRVMAGIAVAQALVLAGMGLAVLVVVVRDGIQGPAAVASGQGVAMEIVVYLLFAAGMAAVAVGAWRGAGWAATPFLLAQLLALTVGLPMATGDEGGVRAAGILVALAAVAGILAWGSVIRSPR